MFSDELNEDVSHIREYFKGKTIFLTGGTGFLGRLIIEKLLRTCSDVRKIYVLVREKKGVDPGERLKEAFNVPAFEPLKKQMPNFFDKLSTCIGDCSLPDLGLSLEDVNILKEEVDCIFHCAATVRFDESLRKAIYINVRAVRDLIHIAKEIKHLSCFLHVSTAYSNCTRKDIDEVFYEPPMKGENLITLADSLSDDLLDTITPTIIGQWPNTYSFTKAVAEGLIQNEVSKLPISVVRPSMIIASAQEPIPGWLDNIYAVNGVLLATGLGLMKTIYLDKSKSFDIIPVDYVVNVILAAAWDSSQKKSVESAAITECDSLNVKEAPIYNYTNGLQNPLSCGDLINYNLKHARAIPSIRSFWYYTFTPIKYRYLYLIAEFFFHTLHGYIIDLFLWLTNRKPMLVEGYSKMRKFTKVITYFTTQDWHFETNHVQKLWKNMNKKDRELFNFDITKLKWDDFCKSYCKGIRVYVMKDPMETVPQGRRIFFIFKIAHYTVLFLMYYCVYFVLKQLVFYFNILK